MPYEIHRQADTWPSEYNNIKLNRFCITSIESKSWIPRDETLNESISVREDPGEKEVLRWLSTADIAHSHFYAMYVSVASLDRWDDETYFIDISQLERDIAQPDVRDANELIRTISEKRPIPVEKKTADLAQQIVRDSDRPEDSELSRWAKRLTNDIGNATD